MTNDAWGWVDKQEERIASERSKDYFNIEEGQNRFVLLSHFAPYAQVFEGGKYRPAQEGDTKGVSVKGICWVMQDDVIKQAKMPYTVVKEVKALAENPDWDFKFPFPHTFTLTAKGAGTKEVEYSLQPSPKTVEIPQAILEELKKKPSPEEIVEKIKGKVSQGTTTTTADTNEVEYPDDEGLKPEDIPF